MGGGGGGQNGLNLMHALLLYRNIPTKPHGIFFALFEIHEINITGTSPYKSDPRCPPNI